MMITLLTSPSLGSLEFRLLSPTSCRTGKALQATSKALFFPMSDAVCFGSKLDCRKTRRITVVTQAGLSTNSYVLAFVLPLSLLSITIFAAARIGDRLDQKFLEEVAINQAIREADEDEDDDTINQASREADEDEDDDMVIPRVEEPALPRARSRPKREV